MYASVWIYKLMKRNDDSVELSRYEKGIKNLIDTFVNSSEILMPLLRVIGARERKGGGGARCREECDAPGER